MTDDLIERLDEFASRLLDDAEREGTKAKPAASLTERVNVFKSITAYLDKRGGRAGSSGKDDKTDERDDNEPTILKLSRQVNRRRRA